MKSCIVQLMLVVAGVATCQSPGKIEAAAIGHEYRQDDMPSICAAADGSIWVAWLSFEGSRDDLAIRRWRNGRWGNLLWVPGTSGDVWSPQVATDLENGVWVVWTQQVKGNWDVYARRFDPSGQRWGALERLTSDPLPDIHPSLASDGKGRMAVAWQGYRAGHSNIFLKTFYENRWSEEIRVTNRAANDWDPTVALDRGGNSWVAYDSYKNGNYDVFLNKVRGGRIAGREIAVATTPRFEARATVAVDTSDRVWVAWETRLANWGKDHGYVLRDRQPGALLVAGDSIRIRCYDAGIWREPEAVLSAAIPGVKPYAPMVVSDGRGSVWVVAHPRKSFRTPLVFKDGYAPAMERGQWEFWATHFDGDRWSQAVLLPESVGRLSMRASAVADARGNLWVAWPTDSRNDAYMGRPIHNRVWAGTLPASATTAAAAWKDPADELMEIKPAHPDEAGDIAAVRAYTAVVGGRKLRIMRGDLHRHTELSWDLGGGSDGSLLDFYRYMIDAAGMDFGASTDHQGGAWPYWWWFTQKMTDMYHVPGAYVPIFGYERSVPYPNGHRNVFFAKREESRVTPFFTREGDRRYFLPVGPLGSEPGVQSTVADNDTKLLYEEVRERNGVIIPHTTGTNQGTDWRDNSPDLEPLVEIFQGSRLSYEAEGAPLAADPAQDPRQMKMTGHRPEGMAVVAWGKGYRLGIVASSDHFSTHLSYAMVYTDDTTRQGIIDAMRARHTYGATDNIILDVRMGEHFMGDTFKLTRPVPIRVRARGTGPIARVDVIKDGRTIYSMAPKAQRAAFEFTDQSGITGRHYYYVRLVQVDKMMAWASPFFVNY